VRKNERTHCVCRALAGFPSELFASTYLDDNVGPKPPVGGHPDDVERAKMYGCAEIRYPTASSCDSVAGGGQ